MVCIVGIQMQPPGGETPTASKGGVWNSVVMANTHLSRSMMHAVCVEETGQAVRVLLNMMVAGAKSKVNAKQMMQYASRLVMVKRAKD